MTTLAIGVEQKQSVNVNVTSVHSECTRGRKMWRSLDEEWENYRKAVLPKDVSSIQLKEIKQAFVAGLWVMLMKMEAISEPHITEKTAYYHLCALKHDCQVFQREMAAKHAEGN